MELDDLKRHLQRHFTDGLVTIIGSGLSAAAGLPTMGQLEEYLRTNMPSRAAPDVKAEWDAIASRLALGCGLEAALLSVVPNPILEESIVELTAEFISQKESDVFVKASAGQLTLPLTRLLPNMLNSADASLITSNYDRLIELAAEIAGYGVDTMFLGSCYATMDRELSKNSFVERFVQRSTAGRAQKIYRRHVKLYKPHGSLDWFDLYGKPIRSPYSLPLKRHIITPGLQKYRKGYETIFETHRQAANESITLASRFLIIGYGFNDDHLEKCLRSQLEAGKPCVVLTMGLSENATKLVSACPNIMALTKHVDPDDVTGTKIYYNGEEHTFPNINLWSLGSFVEEVFPS